MNNFTWNLIKTAPKDGEEVLVCYAHQGGVKKLINWNKLYGYWESKGKPELNMQASHWLRIPAFKHAKEEQGNESN